MDEQNVKRRILIADDDAVSRRILKKFLTQRRYEVTEVADGTSALDALESDGAPRLAVLDWMMPGMEGVQVCQLIRERPDRPYVYILLLTARSEKQDVIQGLKLGADDYLTKPLHAQELEARLLVGERILALQDDLIAAKEELRFKATHDPLTGIVNRGVVMEAIRREHSRQIREKAPFGVILADLDHFKSVNDQYGHLCGDAVLKEAARRMVSCTRQYDIVGRYGGEEFLAVVAGADETIAFALAERMRKAIASGPFVNESGTISITASFGVAASTERAPVDPSAIVQLADEALYCAKGNGRNRSEISKTPKKGAAADAPSGQKAKTKDPAGESLSGLRILLIEDSGSDIELCKRLLVRAYPGSRCDVVDSPLEFSRLVRTTYYDVVLSDYNLQSWTGLAVFKLMRKIGRAIPFILVTGALSETKAVECIKTGITDYVLKDHLERLPIAISRALEEKELLEQHKRIAQALNEGRETGPAVAAKVSAATFLYEGIRCRFVNAAAEQITGYSCDELLAMNFWQLVLPSSKEAIVGESISEPDYSQRRYAMQICTKQRVERWLDVTIGHYEIENQLNMLITAFDITERKRAEAEVYRATQNGPAGVLLGSA